ncbi:acyl-CoA N-acyltransferase [Hypoxylon sp. FL1284]|nr:acyl-CoA N-acyltransferase [Hypoxylon sp. FL1284]
MRAFPPGSDFTYWWPPAVESMRAWQDERIRGWVANPRTRLFKVVEDASGRMVAFAKWDPPASFKGLDDESAVEEPPKDEGGAAEALRGPEGGNEELFRDLFAGMKRLREKWDVDEKLLLHMIAVGPECRGRGIATALMKSVLEVADAEGVPAYLEALPLAVPLYRRLGFVGIDSVEFDIAKAGLEGRPVLTIMMREPGAGGASA